MPTTKEELLKELNDSIMAINTCEQNIFDFVAEMDIINEKISDIEHYIEDEVISRNGAINFTQLIHDLRRHRRQMKQMWEIWQVYGKNREKLKQKDYREMLVSELNKKDEALQTTYRYRQYDKAYLDELNKDIPLPRGRKVKKETYNNIEEEKLDEE